MATLREMIKKAESGDVPSQCAVGRIYYEGKYIQRDYNTSFKWYEKAAKAGDVEAQYILAQMYIKGIGTEEDFGKGLIMMQLAAAQGLVAAKEYVNSVTGFVKQELL